MKYISLILIVITISSCNYIVAKMFGFRIIKEVDEVEYSNFITKCNETGLNMHFVRTDSLNLTSIANCGLSQEYKSLMLQPLQAYLFDGNTVIFL